MRDMIETLFRDAIQQYIPHGKVRTFISCETANLEIRCEDRAFSIGRYEVRLLLESDKRGLDAMGLTGDHAWIFIAAMIADGAPSHRIPPMKSGTRLNEAGERLCKDIAAQIAPPISQEIPIRIAYDPDLPLDEFAVFP